MEVSEHTNEVNHQFCLSFISFTSLWKFYLFQVNKQSDNLYLLNCKDTIYFTEFQNWQAEFELWLPTDLSSCAANKKSKFFQRFSIPKPTTESKQHPPFSDRADSSADPNVPLVDSKETDANMDDQMLWSSMFENDKSESQSKVEDVSHNESFYGEPNDSEYSFVNSGSCLRPFKLFVVRDTVKTMSQRHQVSRNSLSQWCVKTYYFILPYYGIQTWLPQNNLVSLYLLADLVF